MKKGVLRADIQALRFIAVAVVVLFHLWPKRLGGGFIGVDVFFVISGFLITSHIMRDVANGTFSVTKFWARRIRRLMPASVAVLMATFAAVVAFAPNALWEQWLREIQASVLYIENWVLAADAVDYLALGNAASPTQHFWSLSVEEQFYFVWPLLAGLSILVAGKVASRARKIALVVFALIAAGSLVYGIFMTVAQPAVAYFSTPVRAWEFTFGGLIAFLPALAKRGLANWFALLGLGMIAASALLLEPEMAFPGYLALLPVVGTCLVIWAAVDSGWLYKIAAFKPFQWVGDRSYSIYLWHWPLIILMPYVINQELTNRWRLVILVATVVLAWASHKFIEQPFMASGGKRQVYRPRMVFAWLAVSSVIAVGSIAIVQMKNNYDLQAEFVATQQLAESRVPCFGAGARAPGEAPCLNPDIEGVFPSVEAALSDYSFSSRVCGSMKRDDAVPKVCKLGVEKSDTRIALIGDSHMGQYVGAFVGLAKDNNWELELYWKGGCPFSDTRREHDAVLGSACDAWVVESERLIMAGDYDLVVTSMASGVDWKLTNGDTPEESAEVGLAAMWQGLNDAGIPVVAIKDNPRPPSGQNKCLQLEGLDVCDAERATAFKYDPMPGAHELVNSPMTQLMDFDEVFCDADKCFAIIGNVVVYRGDNHLTNTFTTTMAPYIEPYLIRALNLKYVQ